MTELVKLEFMNSENAQLTASCAETVFQGSEWIPQDMEDGAINRADKRFAEAFLEDKDAVAFGGMIFYGHVLVSQERTINPDNKIVGVITNIVPMDDAKVKPMQGRSGYYGIGIHKMGVCPTT